MAQSPRLSGCFRQKSPLWQSSPLANQTEPGCTAFYSLPSPFLPSETWKTKTTAFGKPGSSSQPEVQKFILEPPTSDQSLDCENQGWGHSAAFLAGNKHFQPSFPLSPAKDILNSALRKGCTRSFFPALSLSLHVLCTQEEHFLPLCTQSQMQSLSQKWKK